MQGVDDENLPPAQREDGDQLYRIVVRAISMSAAIHEYNDLGGTNGVGNGVFNFNIDNEANTGGNRANVLIIRQTVLIPVRRLVWKPTKTVPWPPLQWFWHHRQRRM